MFCVYTYIHLLMSIPVSRIWVHFLSLVLKIPSPKQESVEAISIGPGLNDGFKGRRMVAEREEARASSVHHLDRATIRQIENTLPRIQYRGYTSKNMLWRMYFQEHNISRKHLQKYQNRNYYCTLCLVTKTEIITGHYVY